MTAGVDATTVVAIALALDVALGDPPSPWHPVGWIGAAIDLGRRRFAHGSPARLFVAGAAVTLTVAALAGTAGWGVTVVARRLGFAGLVVDAIALGCLFSVRGLAAAARSVAGALERGDLASARARVGRDLVSRATAELDGAHVASAAIESVAENLPDSVVAPLLFYLAFGLPGAAVYRAVNTADAMIGYRDGALEYFGKAAARLDDLLTVVPARLSALALGVAALGRGCHVAEAFRGMRADHARTASPNAGWPMAAMAGALGVVLEKTASAGKPTGYRLGRGPLPTAADVRRSVGLLGVASAVAIAACVAVRLAIGR